MAETTPFTIGSDAYCADGVGGEVTWVVVDPVARELTHLAVEPKGREGLARLVPLDLVEVEDGQIRLRCTLAEFEKLDPAEETEFVPGTRGYEAYGPTQVVAWPYSSFAGDADPAIDDELVTGVSETVTYDTVPLGEVEVRRDEQVHATDGTIGKVEGLVIDPASRHVTHVLLQEGHLWGRKEVAVPISAVTSVEDGIQLNLTKHEIQHLPPVNIDHPDW